MSKTFTNLTRTLSLLGLIAVFGVSTGASAAQPSFRGSPSARLGGMSAAPRGPSMSPSMGMKTAPQFNSGNSFKNQMGNLNASRVTKPGPILNSKALQGAGNVNRLPPIVSVKPRTERIDPSRPPMTGIKISDLVGKKPNLNPIRVPGLVDKKPGGLKPIKLPGLVDKKPGLNGIKFPGLVNKKPGLNPIKLPGLVDKKFGFGGGKLASIFHHNDPWCHTGGKFGWGFGGSYCWDPCYNPCWDPCYNPCWNPCYNPCWDPCYYPSYDPCYTWYDPCYTYYPSYCYPTYPVYTSYPVVVNPVVKVEVAAAAVNAADLIITDLVQLEAGDAAANVGPLLEITVKNDGTVNAGKFGLGAFASLKNEPGDKMVSAGQELEGLAAGESRTVEIRLPVEALAMRADKDSSPEAFKKVFVVADTKNTVSEADEKNNLLPVERSELAVDAVAAK